MARLAAKVPPGELDSSWRAIHRDAAPPTGGPSPFLSRAVRHDTLERINVDEHFVASICGVEVSRSMLAMEHSNNHAEESADLGHVTSLRGRVSSEVPLFP
jgi:hypothetical protein